MLDELYFEVTIIAAVSALAAALVVLMLPDDTLGQIEDWRVRLHASIWRWPLTALFSLALAVTLWIVVDAARFVLAYYR